MQNIVPFCRECGSKVEEDWVACPKCGSKTVPTSTNQNDGSSDMKTTVNTVIEKSDEKPNSSNIALLLLVIMFMVILIPGEADMSLLSWGDENCDVSFSSTGNSNVDQILNEGSESYESYCSKKKATLFFCVLIIIACISVHRKKPPQISEEDIEGEEEKFACEECGHCPVMESDSTCPNCGAMFEDDDIASSSFSPQEVLDSKKKGKLTWFLFFVCLVIWLLIYDAWLTNLR
jgi:hypothetical protein